MLTASTPAVENRLSETIAEKLAVALPLPGPVVAPTASFSCSGQLGAAAVRGDP
jgi:hypothetical protein